MEAENMGDVITELEEEMAMAAKNRDYEKAADLRDEIAFLRDQGMG